MSSYTRQQLEEWLKTLGPIKGRVLDIGGSQLPVVKRLQNTDIYFEDYKILDLEQPHECKQKPDIVCDLNDRFFDEQGAGQIKILNKLEGIPQFDVAFCLEVSEYWYNPFYALKNIADLLKPNGVLYISFHFIYPVHNPPEQDYLRYTPAGVRKLLKETGFEVIDMQPRKMKDLSRLYGWWATEGMRPSKENYHQHDWAGCLVKCRKI